MQRNIEQLVNRLVGCMQKAPVYPSQGAVLFCDLGRKEIQKRYLPLDVFRTFLGGRGANAFLLYNLLLEERAPLDPDTPLIFGTGILTGRVPGATRGNVTGRSPDSRAIMDSSAGGFFPSFMRLHGYDHIVLFGRSPEWTLLRITPQRILFEDAAPYRGMNNLDFTAAVERDFSCREGRDMAMARITRAGENLVLSSGIMGGIKSIWARGGTGAVMGSLRLKGIMIHGRPEKTPAGKTFRENNRKIAKKILSTGVVANALKRVGTPFLYKPSRILGAIGTKNNQETCWHPFLDAENLEPYRSGMEGCYKCPVRCRRLNALTRQGGGKGEADDNGQDAGKKRAAQSKREKSSGASPSFCREKGKTTPLIDDLPGEKKRARRENRERGNRDKYDTGEGPEYVTVGKMGPAIGISDPAKVIRLNNILNDLGLDAASTGGAIAWAMELFQRGIITKKETGSMALTWGNYPVVERLLFMTADRQGFGDIIADSARAVSRGRYPEEALGYRMAVKGLFQSDPHDARLIKGFALGLAVATRGMDHLRNRPTLEINARINDDPDFKRSLYGAEVSGNPAGYGGKEHAVYRCESLFAAGDAVGMCRFNTRLFNSPTLPGPDDFATQVTALTGIRFSPDDILEAGENINALERMVNFRLGLRAKDDTLPRRWFEEETGCGPFAGEKIDPAEFEALKARFYEIAGLNKQGLPIRSRHETLSLITTGFAVWVKLPGLFRKQAPEGGVMIDAPLTNVAELRQALVLRLPEAADLLKDHSLNMVVNDSMVLGNERSTPLKSGDRVTLVSTPAGG